MRISWMNAIRGRSIVCAGIVALAFILLPGVMSRGSVAQENAPTEAYVIFGELNDSGIDGFATLTAEGDQTVVRIQAEGALGDHPTHIHQGQCEDLDPNPEIPLTNVQLPPTGVTGKSETTIDVPLDEILAEDRLILIHRSEADLDTYLACGNVEVGALPEEHRALGDDGNPLPGTGAGLVSTDSRFSPAFGLVLAATGIGLGMMSARVRRSSRRA